MNLKTKIQITEILKKSTFIDDLEIVVGDILEVKLDLKDNQWGNAKYLEIENLTNGNIYQKYSFTMFANRCGTIFKYIEL